MPSIVIGAGVVGLAVARALAMAGLEPLVLEKNAVFGEETSARNSEVIHAGIYYDAGSAKARHCVAGKRMLYEYCAARGVGNWRCGKLIVAADDCEVDTLAGIATRAAANGVDDLEALDTAQVMALEPSLEVAGALLSPSTGVVDSHALMLAYIGDIEAHGGQIVTHTQVKSGRVEADGAITLLTGGKEPLALTSRHVVNTAGLWAQDVARRIEGLMPPPPLALVKGNYFGLRSKAPFSRLIYPAPVDGGLGVHLTLDMAGRAKFGPDTEWLDHAEPGRIDYTVDPTRGEAFYAAIRRYWPGLQDGALVADYAGMRPKIAGGNYPDFRIDGPEVHGLAGHVMLYGIESPGLTSSLSIAEEVVALMQR